MEELIEPNSINLFRERGIDVSHSAQNIKGEKDGQIYYQIDLLLYNEKFVVVIEVKNNLKVVDIDEHLDRLEKIKRTPPAIINLRGKTILGAVAGIVVDEFADKYAFKKGLFVLRQKGNIVKISNKKGFKPKEWKIE